MPDRSSTLLAIGGLVALLAWTCAWVVTGAVAGDYDPSDQYISELFETGASTRPLMTAFIALLGLALTVWLAALALRAIAFRPAPEPQ